LKYEFGGQADARAFPWFHVPTCLDVILMGYNVTMVDLEFLFGMEHHRFPKQLSHVRDRRKVLYSAFAVVKIMDALLKEGPAERKPRARGGSEKKLWLNNADIRNRVLNGIGWRALAISQYREILAAFMNVVSRHLASGDSKERLFAEAEAHIRSLRSLASLGATSPDSGK
jgi:hypothetical protein